MIDWAKFGIEIISFAQDGIKGLELINNLKPDIVFTDIRMPGIDGLTLIDKAKVSSPDTVFVVFSGYNEFEYAKSAIDHGVIDYLDKPITIKKVEKVILKVLNVINHRREFIVMKEILDSDKKRKIEYYLLQMIKGNIISEDKLTALSQTISINILGIDFITVGCAKLVNNEILNDDQYEIVKNIYEYNIIKNDLVCFTLKEEDGFILILTGKLKAVNTAELADNLEKCRLACEQNNLNFYMGMGRSYSNISKIHDSYLEANKALKYSIFMETSDIINLNDVEYRNNIPLRFEKNEDSIVFNMRTGNKQRVLAQVKEYLISLKNDNLSPHLFCHACLELIYLGMKVARETGKEFTDKEGMSFFPHLEIDKYKSYDEIISWMIIKFEEILDWISDIKKYSNHRSIAVIREYINKNYNTQITLEQLADMANMNPTYFSMVFKDETGITYVKYLTKIRIEKAKALLLQGYKVYEVSELVGYQNYRYFCDIFKKNTGVTPEKFKGIVRTK